MEIEFKFGLLQDMDVYKLGDRLKWGEGRGERFPKKRPNSGCYNGLGYAVCDACERDFFVDIDVDNDVIASVCLSQKNGYIS